MNVILFTDMNGIYGFGRNLGAYTISNILRQNGFTVQTIDFFASITMEESHQIVDKFVDNETLAVAFSTSFFQVNKDKLASDTLGARERWFECTSIPQGETWFNEFKQIFLKKNPNIKFIMGGSQTARNKNKLKDLDYIFIGESDERIVTLLKQIRDNIIQEQRLFNNLYGAYENFETTRMTWTESDLLFPDECLPMELERGCPFNCAFCNFRKTPKKQVKDVNIVREEMIYNYEQFGISKYMITDLTFTSSRKKIEDFCNMFISLPFKLEWVAMARLFMFKRYPYFRELFLEAGAKSLFFGIESMNAETLKSINKYLDPGEIKNTLHYLKETWDKEIFIFVSFIAGLPYETEDQIRNTVKWLMDPKSPIDSFYMSKYYIQDRYKDLNEIKTFSIIEKDLEKYGYKIVDGRWINTISGMTQDIAEQISSYTHDVSGCKVYTYYMMRMKTLGYSSDELWNIMMDYKESFVDSENRKLILKNKYVRELLK